MFQPKVSISHAGFLVYDMDKMVDFYTDLFGFEVTDRDDEKGFTFLSGDPSDHHQLFFVKGREKELGQGPLFHVAFRVDSLDRVREIHDKLQANPEIGDIEPMTHGNTWSVYFTDPEGNKAEAFVDAPYHRSQPFIAPFDISKSDEEIAEYTESLVKEDPTAQPFDEWKEGFKERLSENS